MRLRRRCPQEHPTGPGGRISHHLVQPACPFPDPERLPEYHRRDRQDPRQGPNQAQATAPSEDGPRPKQDGRPREKTKDATAKPEKDLCLNSIFVQWRGPKIFNDKNTPGHHTKPVWIPTRAPTGLKPVSTLQVGCQERSSGHICPRPRHLRSRQLGGQELRRTFVATPTPCFSRMERPAPPTKLPESVQSADTRLRRRANPMATTRMRKEAAPRVPALGTQHAPMTHCHLIL